MPVADLCRQNKHPKRRNYEHTDKIRIHAVIPGHGLAQGPFTGRDPTGREPDESLVRPFDRRRQGQGWEPLFHEGKIVSQKRGRSVSDGPFAESKEAIGGFFLLEVGSLDEAAEIAKDFPALEYGATVEVRPVAPECMIGETAQQKNAREARLLASA